MPRGGAHFSSEQLVRALSHYDIGLIHELKPFAGGNRRVPKAVITAEGGTFLLKRRTKGKDDLYHVAFAHAIQIHLAKAGFPVPGLVATATENNTILQINNHICELFIFVNGTRYDGSVEETVEAGRQLAKFHQHLADFAHEWKPLKSSFHDSSTVRRRLKRTPNTLLRTRNYEPFGRDKNPTDEKQSQHTIELLTALYNHSSIAVNQLGFDSWSQQVVHGDWHPGNMLFANKKLAAVFDFDSVKIAPPVTDLANAMLQFSIVANRPNPADWPDYFDQAKIVQLLEGYRQVITLKQNEIDSLIDLMIETIIAETVLPIAATGFFGQFSGLDFLKMIQKKALWLDKNRKKIAKAIKNR